MLIKFLNIHVIIAMAAVSVSSLPAWPQSLSEVLPYLQMRWQAALQTAGESSARKRALQRVGVDREIIRPGTYHNCFLFSRSPHSVMATRGVTLPYAGASCSLSCRGSLWTANHEEQATIGAETTHDHLQFCTSVALLLHVTGGGFIQQQTCCDIRIII